MRDSSPISADPSEPIPTWGLAVGLVGYVIAVFTSIFAVSVLAAVAPDQVRGVPGVAVSSVGLWIGFAGATSWAVRDKASLGARLRALGVQQRWLDPLIGLPAGVATQGLAIPGLYWLLFLVIGERDVDGPARDLLAKGSGLGSALLVVVVGIGAPVMEEVFFRGLLQRAAVTRFGATVGVGLVAVGFASTHFQPLQFPGLLVAGLAFGVLAQRSGRLGPAIWAHIGFNLTTIVLLAMTEGS